MAKRRRRAGSAAIELVKKAREAMLTAVQIFNNPQIEFKSELFIVASIVAWTYLLHAYYRKKGIEYRKFTQVGKRRKFLKTRFGAIWHWSLDECLESADCPVEDIVKKNLRFLIGVRNEIEHQMTTRIDHQFSAKFQASAVNFNRSIKKLFSPKFSLDAEQAFSIQFSGINEDAAKELLAQKDLPQHIRSFVVQFENGLSKEEYNDERFSYRVAFVRKTSNTKTAADSVIQFVAAGSETGAEMNRVFLRETEKLKYLPSTIVRLMKAEGFTGFGMHQHSEFWHTRDAKNARYQFGVQVEKQWFWYESWLTEVRKYGNKSLDSHII